MRERMARYLKDFVIGESIYIDNHTTQILTLIAEEIEKGLLTDEEIEVAYWKYSWDELADIFPDTSGRMIDLRRKAVAQAQLDKILALLRGRKQPKNVIGSVEL